ncbi:molybdate transport system substrate-binding protein [Georgenia satyanarayanai]|uniref:Molybdate transport system substrate-binding protein n=1 Tax=Georgenia satyanarayanai TaxID=860221 RepID=A0A2Y9A5T1_9MICO|nr:molybdate ABC transporter substrate-binding protein [Georgenia satyanarayanai]PYG01017.1 molybdate transport system substrate-binding protein [Georgenia satyanarayanai]SSA39256.1 molybdate transport system substrate-binding protein [Georgenia satyanarayanai]
MTRGRGLAAAVVVALGLGACGGADAGSAAAPDERLTVLAAASLHGVFEDLAEVFTEQHPGAEVAFSFAGSSDLVAQLDAGVPADVLATADETTMARAVASGTVAEEPEIFARNVLTLVVPSGNPADVTGLDGSLEDVALVVCAPQVPCGAATATLAGLHGVSLAPVSEEGSVTDVLGKVTSGEADAGLVYRTDAAAAGNAVEAVPVARAGEVLNRYPVAVTADAADPELAAAWVDLLLGREAQQVLDEAGFLAP